MDSKDMAILDYVVLGGDLLWTIAYIQIIVTSWRHRVTAIPIVAICLNFSWEIVFTTVYPPTNEAGALDVPLMVLHSSWLILDVVIFWMALKLLRNTVRFPFVKRHGVVLFLGLLIAGVLGEIAYVIESGDNAGLESALAINLVMSALFIHMLLNRPDMRGISLSVAWLKALGTGITGFGFLAATLRGDFTLQEEVFSLFLFSFIALFDAAYIFLIHQGRIGKLHAETQGPVNVDNVAA